MPNESTLEFTAKEREALFIQLYTSTFPAVAKYVSRKGGSFDEAKDVFQDAVVIYYEKLTGTGLQVNTSKEAYLFGIVRHLWSRHQRQQAHIAGSDTNMAIADGSSPVASHGKLLAFLQQTGSKCMDLLHAFYYDKLTMKEVAQNFGFSSERSATVQKYKCLEKVRDTVKQKALAYEDFLD